MVEQELEAEKERERRRRSLPLEEFSRARQQRVASPLDDPESERNAMARPSARFPSPLRSFFDSRPVAWFGSKAAKKPLGGDVATLATVPPEDRPKGRGKRHGIYKHQPRRKRTEAVKMTRIDSNLIEEKEKEKEEEEEEEVAEEEEEKEEMQLVWVVRTEE